APEALSERAVVSRRVVAGGADAIARIVDRLAGAPEDAVVGGQAVVVEERPRVADAPPLAPADRRALRRGQRIAGEDIIVERDETPAQSRQEMVAVRVRRQHDLARPKPAGPGVHDDSSAAAPDSGHAGLLEDPN